MKCLLIAEDDEVISKVSEVLKEKGLDVITYRWLLKALDNVEEIAPHLAIISTREYPRHWKTFVQFTESSIGGIIPKIILYNSIPLDQGETQKAEALGITGSFSSLEKEGLDKLRRILDQCMNTKSESETPEEKPGNFPCVFRSLENNQVISGMITDFSGNEIQFVPDLPAKFLKIPVDSEVRFSYLNEKKAIRKIQAKITGIGKTISLKVENGN